MVTDFEPVEDATLEEEEENGEKETETNAKSPEPGSSLTHLRPTEETEASAFTGDIEEEAKAGVADPELPISPIYEDEKNDSPGISELVKAPTTEYMTGDPELPLVESNLNTKRNDIAIPEVSETSELHLIASSSEVAMACYASYNPLDY